MRGLFFGGSGAAQSGYRLRKKRLCVLVLTAFISGTLVDNRMEHPEITAWKNVIESLKIAEQGSLGVCKPCDGIQSQRGCHLRGGN